MVIKPNLSGYKRVSIHLLLDCDSMTLLGTALWQVAADDDYHSPSLLLVRLSLFFLPSGSCFPPSNFHICFCLQVLDSECWVIVVFFLLYSRFLHLHHASFILLDLASLLAGFVGFLPLEMFPLSRILVPPILLSFLHQFLISSFLFLEPLILFSPILHLCLFSCCLLSSPCAFRSIDSWIFSWISSLHLHSCSSVSESWRQSF